MAAELAFVRAELRGQETSSFCDFFKVTSCNFTPFHSFWLNQTFVFWNVLCKEYYSRLAKLCPKMIHVDALDFKEYRSEEVISFFWRSV